MEGLSQTHAIMVAPQIKAAQKEIDFGCKRINWGSSGTVSAEVETFV